MSRRALLLMLLLAPMLAMPPAILAAASTSAAKAGLLRQGWWSVDGTGNKAVGQLTNPDVPATGLLVQGDGSSSPVAFAALAYSIPRKMEAASLTLTVAPTSVSTATPASSELEVCPLDSPNFQAAQGGALSASPPYGCSHHVTAKPKSGTTYHFSLTSLHLKASFGIAVLSTSTPARLVFDKPAANALTVKKAPRSQTPAPTPSFSTAAAAPSSAASSATGSSGGDGGAGGISLPSSGTSTSQGAPAQSPDVAPPAATPTATPTAALAGQSASAASSGRSDIAIAAILVMVLVSGVLWLLAGSRTSQGTEAP